MERFDASDIPIPKDLLDRDKNPKAKTEEYEFLSNIFS
jgi:hypothetical protein